MEDLPPAPAEYLEIIFDGAGSDPLELDFSSVQNNALRPFAVSDLYWADVISANCLTRGEDVKRVYDLILNMKNCGFPLVPGDAVGIFPHNDKEEVEHLLKRLGILEEIDSVCEVCIRKNTTKKNPSVPAFIPVKSTLRHIFETCLDLHVVPKKAKTVGQSKGTEGQWIILYAPVYLTISFPASQLFIRALLDYTTDPQDQKALHDLCSRKSERYAEWISSGQSCVSTLLSDYPSCRPPVSLMLEHLPRLQPRPYSIAFLSGKHENHMHLAFSVVTYFSGGSRKTGVCSGWLENITHSLRSAASQPSSLCKQMEELQIQQGSSISVKIPLYLRKSNGFHFPSDIFRPLIMVGPGVGVAPFIGFLQQREQLLKTHGTFDDVATCWLFFGCRYSGKDEIYSEELVRQVDAGTLDRYIMAHSRDSKAKAYVQDNLRVLGRDICRMLLEDDGYFFICGDAHNMARSVLSIIVDAISKYKNINKAEAQKVVLQLQEKGHYKEDVWTIQDDIYRMFNKAVADEKRRQGITYGLPPEPRRQFFCDMV